MKKPKETKKAPPKKDELHNEEEKADDKNSTIAESTKELLKWRKKVREMESILAQQESGARLDPAQVKKLSSLDSARAELKKAEETEEERLQQIHREEKARAEEER